jgi:hypothetical protein
MNGLVFGMEIPKLTQKDKIAWVFTAILVSVLLVTSACAQGSSQAATTGHATLAPLSAPLGVPQPGAETEAPYSPLPILPGGIVVPLYPPGLPFLNMNRIREPEHYNLNQAVPGAHQQHR